MSRRSTLHARLTDALHTVLVDLHKPDIGHSLTGDVACLRDDAKRLADAAMGTVAKLQTDLDAATHFLVGPYRVAYARHRRQWEVWPDPTFISLTRIDPPEAFDDRDEALAYARVRARCPAADTELKTDRSTK